MRRCCKDRVPGKRNTKLKRKHVPEDKTSCLNATEPHPPHPTMGPFTELGAQDIV